MVLYQIIILKVRSLTSIFRHLSCLQMYVCILCMTLSIKTRLLVDFPKLVSMATPGLWDELLETHGLFLIISES